VLNESGFTLPWKNGKSWRCHSGDGEEPRDAQTLDQGQPTLLNTWLDGVNNLRVATRMGRR